MRQVYTRLIRKEFGAFARTLTPAFESFRTKSLYHPPGETVVAAEVGPNLRLFLGLMINPKGKQCFTIWFGWSKLGRFPELDERNVMERVPDETRFSNEEFRERVGAFLNEDKWWFLEDKGNIKAHFSCEEVSNEEARVRVSRALAEVKAAVETHVMPYLRAFMKNEAANEGEAGVE